MTTPVDLINAAIARIAEADREAEASGLAFTLGADRFVEYYEKRTAATLARLEAEYGAINSDGGNRQANVGMATGTEGGSGSGGA